MPEWEHPERVGQCDTVSQSKHRKEPDMATKTTTKKTTTTTKPAKVSKWDAVTDDTTDSSAELVAGLMAAEGDYATRVAHDGPIIAKRIANGEKNADIARDVVALLAGQGKTVKQNTAAQKVSRYARIGEAIINAKKGDDLQEVIAKASAKVRGKGGNPGGRKTHDEKVAIVLDTLVKLIAKGDRAQTEKTDTALTTVIGDAIARRYAELDTAEKVA